MKYEVEITRISYATMTFLIEANSEDEAKDVAMDEAYTTSFDEDTAEYEINSCYESELTDEECPTNEPDYTPTLYELEDWWRHNGIWDRQQASGIRVEDYDGETNLYMQSTDDWWDGLTEAQKLEVYNEFFEEV